MSQLFGWVSRPQTLKAEPTGHANFPQKWPKNHNWKIINKPWICHFNHF